MNRTATGPQPLRALPGNSFASQPSNTRSQPLGGQRIQNGKLGSSGWGGFGVPIGAGAPGLSSSPSRTNTLSGFSQAIGGSASQAPLDLSGAKSKRWKSLAIGISAQGNVDFSNADFGDEKIPDKATEDAASTESAAPTSSVDNNDKTDPTVADKADSMSSEFPSLSGGGPQSQNFNAQPQAWNSTALRQTQPLQQTPVQRPGALAGTQQREGSIQQSQHPSAQTDTSFHFGSGMDSQYDGQRSSAARSDNNSTQMSTSDDFPPLGGNLGGVTRLDREGGMLQGSGFGTGLGSSAFGQSRNGGVGGHMGGQGDRFQNSAMNNDGNPTSLLDTLRSPSDTHRTPDLSSDPQREATRQRDASNPSVMSQQLPSRDGAFSDSQQPHTGQSNNSQQQSHSGSKFSTKSGDSPTMGQQQPARKKLADMTEIEKWGLPGLLATLPGNGADSNPFVMGHDISTLGIDFDSPEPIFPTFSTPFADANSRPAIPEFTLPSAYSVNNVPALLTRMSNFSDETLFAIFYQYPKDLAQEAAAEQLYSRDWRWHKELRQWMMKDSGMSNPVRITERSERGVYVFFDAANWRRERRDFILDYDHLDQRHGPTQGGAN